MILYCVCDLEVVWKFINFMWFKCQIVVYVI